jgi:hypothetical protein
MKIYLLLFYIISFILCDSTLQTINDIISSNSNYASACKNIIPYSKMDCAIATLEWDYKCCFIYIKNGKNKENKKCVYIEDKDIIIKKFSQLLEKENKNYKVTCDGIYMKYKIYLITFILLLF